MSSISPIAQPVSQPISQPVSQIEIVRQGRHRAWKHRQLTLKWAPIIVSLMHRRKNAAIAIQRCARKHLFFNTSSEELLCSSETQGMYRVHLLLQPSAALHKEWGMSAEEWAVNGITSAIAVVVDAREVTPDGMLFVRGMTYVLSSKQLTKIVQLQKKLANIRYVQDMEYYKSLSIDMVKSLKDT